MVSPLIALMADQWRRLTADGHPAVMIASGLPEEVARDAMAQIRDGRARIVYCSPERFAQPGFMNAVGQREVDLLAVDEAHCISEWGHDFRPDYLRLPRVLERLGRPTVMACTATATEDVSSEIAERLGLRDPLMIRAGFDRPNLSFDIVQFEGKGSKARKLAMLLHGLRDEANRPAIVYCGTRKDTEEVAQSLREAGLSAAGYHAGMDPDERASAQHRFMTGDAEVITATNAFGMGVDKANVRSVWHWAIPTSVEAYYQEAGRAGRDGLPARAVLLAGRSDLGRLVRFIQMREVEPESVSLYAQRLKAGSDCEGNLTIDAPRVDEDRVKLAIAERAGAFEVEPAPGGRLELRFNDRIDMAAARAACKAATDRSWRAYRAVESFSFGESCRRRRLLDHFGDSTPGAPEGRCCDVCDPESWLPVARGARGEGEAPELEVRLSPSRPLTRGRVAARGAPGLAAEGRARKARLHGRQQPDPGGDRRRAPSGSGRTRRRSTGSARRSWGDMGTQSSRWSRRARAALSSSIRGVIPELLLCMESGTSASWEGLSRPAPASSTPGSPRDCSLQLATQVALPASRLWTSCRLGTARRSWRGPVRAG